MSQPKALASVDFMPKWDVQGACYGLPEIMYPDERNPQAIAVARAVCHRCPVLDRCRAWVLSLPFSGDPGGIVAAMTQGERVDAVHDGFHQCARCRRILPLDQFSPKTADDPAPRANCKGCRNKPLPVDAEPSEPLKKCPRCKTVRGRSRFYPNSQNPDGLTVWCKPCINEPKGTR